VGREFLAAAQNARDLGQGRQTLSRLAETVLLKAAESGEAHRMLQVRPARLSPDRLGGLIINPCDLEQPQPADKG
jgi:hypothetical protein